MPNDVARAPSDTPAELRRVQDADGRWWSVRESTVGSLERRTVSSLIFETDAVIRRVRVFPPDWAALSDYELYELSLGP